MVLSSAFWYLLSSSGKEWSVGILICPWSLRSMFLGLISPRSSLVLRASALAWIMA